MESTPRISIVVNTLNRAHSLGRTLDSFRQLTYPSFEVVVVNGPSTDDSQELIDSYSSKIKIRRCPKANLSMSRNIGIAAAAGEIVAFIDDDGVPEPVWLDELVQLYDSEAVGGAGGVVHDHTGYSYQCKFNSSDRLGNASVDNDGPLDHWCYPGAANFPYLIGTNASFRRDVLIEVGGFDEEIEYYLDETDVCLRVVDAGYILRQGSGATVHHKFLPSALRSEARVTLNNFPIVKNKIYFSFVNSDEGTSFTRLMSDDAAFADFRARDLSTHVALGNITFEQRTEGLAQIDRAWLAGLEAGRRGRQSMLSTATLLAESEEFKPFPTVQADGRRLRLCFVTQTLPPTEIGGIGRYMLDLARGLSARGHEIRVITTGEDHSTVDLEDGVWVHRILKDDLELSDSCLPPLPCRVGENATAVAAEVVRLHGQRPFDAVYAAVWDTESIAVFERCAVPVVTALVTTMGITLRTRPEWRSNAEFMAHLGDPLLALERFLFQHSDAIHAISHAIIDEVELTSGVQLDRSGIVVSPLSTVDRAIPTQQDHASSDDALSVLFVGRFEKRKGIDLILEAVPEVLQQFPLARFEFIGRDDLAGEGGISYRQEFELKFGDAPWFDRVSFRGQVPDSELWKAYATADVFVAPSRFESFGLIFVEAMMNSTPVVALRSGAAPELLEHRETALLVDPDATGGVAEAISELLSDSDLRVRLGTAGRKVFEERYTERSMVDGIEAMFRGVSTVRPSDPGFPEVDPESIVQLEDQTSAVDLETANGVSHETVLDARSSAIFWVRPEQADAWVDVSGTVTKFGNLKVGRYEHVLLTSPADQSKVQISASAGVLLAAIVSAGAPSV
ncbi:MAG: glycosyltransferase [Actinomycetes bacterium]